MQKSFQKRTFPSREMPFSPARGQGSASHTAGQNRASSTKSHYVSRTRSYKHNGKPFVFAHPKARVRQSIFITGASSGLGKALAEVYASPNARLYLCGRNKARLEQTALIAREKGAQVHTFLFDVTNASSARKAVQQAFSIAPIDLLIANAGVSGGVLGVSEDSAQTRQIFDTNIGGVTNVVLPALEQMRKRKTGQIAIVSSIAGYRGMPSAPAYSASKACVKAWGEALRGWLYKEGIRVNVICPGFIRTPLTKVNRFPMPFLMAPECAARKIQKGITRNKALITFPWPMTFGAWIMAALPAWIIHPILCHLPKK